MRRRLRGDAGAVTTELVIATPAFLFLIMMIIQGGLYFHAVALASAAAQDGARTAAVGGTDESVAAGKLQAEQMLAELAPTLLQNKSVNGRLVDNREMAEMRVEGDVIRVFVFPGANVSFHVQEIAETAVERFRPADDVPTDTNDPPPTP
jgi:Flp pilus assembly protein TadG